MKTYVIMLSKVFPKGHRREGEQTGFKEKLLSHEKIHTIRSNYALWEKRIKEVQEGEAILSVRQWEDKPYRSKQVEIVRFTEESGIGIQKLEIQDLSRPATVAGKIVELQDIANADGLEFNDFYHWFKGYSFKEPMAIIHFTRLRYRYR